MKHNGHSSYKAELEGIKAPLGVLLYLIRRDNIDVYDIPVAKITQDYLAYLDLMEEMQIDLAGEFFVLAATLMRLKGQLLLRRDDDEDDPREELVRNLLEYKKIVEAARSFKEMETQRLKMFSRPVPKREKEYRGDPILELNLYEIMRAFQQIMVEFGAADTSEIVPEEYTVDEKIEVILGALERSGQVTFRDLFSGMASRFEIVVSFIAMLELMKRGRIRARQEGIHGEVWLYPEAPRGKPSVTDEFTSGHADER